MRLIYEAGSQLGKVRFLMAFAFACAVGAVLAGVHLGRTYGMADADGGVLRPLPERLAWGIGVGALGIAFAAAMGLYGRLYVARIELDDSTGEVHVHTVRWIGSRRHVLARTAFGRSRLHDGKPLWAQLLFGWRLSQVNAPWWTLPVRGRRIPLIVDVQGRVHDRKRFRGLLASASAETGPEVVEERM